MQWINYVNKKSLISYESVVNHHYCIFDSSSDAACFINKQQQKTKKKRQVEYITVKVRLCSRCADSGSCPEAKSWGPRCRTAPPHFLSWWYDQLIIDQFWCAINLKFSLLFQQSHFLSDFLHFWSFPIYNIQIRAAHIIATHGIGTLVVKSSVCFWS